MVNSEGVGVGVGYFIEKEMGERSIKNSLSPDITYRDRPPPSSFGHLSRPQPNEEVCLRTRPACLFHTCEEADEG